MEKPHNTFCKHVQMCYRQGQTYMPDMAWEGSERTIVCCSSPSKLTDIDIVDRKHRRILIITKLKTFRGYGL